MYDHGIDVCCGAQMLSRFGNEVVYDDGEYGGKRGKAKLKRDLEGKIKGWRYQAFLIVILNELQWELIGETFIEVGFQVVDCGWSGQRSSRLRLLTYTRHKMDIKKDNKKVGEYAKKRAS